MRLLVSVFLLASSVFAAERNKTDQRLDEAATVFSEMMAAPDKGIPHDLLEKAHCVVIVPGLKKGAFVVGVQYGKGFVSCRESGGKGCRRPGPFESRAALWVADWWLRDRRRDAGDERSGSSQTVVQPVYSGRRR